MRILIADSFDQEAAAALAEEHEVVSDPELTASTLPDGIAGFDVVIVRSTGVDAKAIAASDRLSLIVRAGAGTNTIDVEAAASRGIYVSNIPGRNSIAVAELTMGLLLALDRRIPDAVADLREGRWRKGEYQRADGLFGKRIGIIGLGEIGLAVADRAAAFGIVVRGVARSGRAPEFQERLEAIGVDLLPDLYSLAGDVDIVSLHVPASHETSGLVDREFLSHCRDGTWIINTSRGDVIDEEALLEVLDHRGFWAALDVYADEPGASEAEFRSPLTGHPHVYGTHHVGASTGQAQRAIASAVVDIVVDFARGEVRNCVNLAPRRPDVETLLVRHHNRVGVLSSILRVIRQAGINVREMDNRILAGGTAATATLHCTGGDISGDVLAELESVENVIAVSRIS